MLPRSGAVCEMAVPVQLANKRIANYTVGSSREEQNRWAEFSAVHRHQPCRRWEGQHCWDVLQVRGQRTLPGDDHVGLGIKHPKTPLNASAASGHLSCAELAAVKHVTLSQKNGLVSPVQLDSPLSSTCFLEPLFTFVFTALNACTLEYL